MDHEKTRMSLLRRDSSKFQSQQQIERIPMQDNKNYINIKPNVDAHIMKTSPIKSLQENVS